MMSEEPLTNSNKSKKGEENKSGKDSLNENKIDEKLTEQSIDKKAEKLQSSPVR